MISLTRFSQLTNGRAYLETLRGAATDRPALGDVLGFVPERRYRWADREAAQFSFSKNAPFYF
jgi:hypothetical protein